MDEAKEAFTSQLGGLQNQVEHLPELKTSIPILDYSAHLDRLNDELESTMDLYHIGLREAKSQKDKRRELILLRQVDVLKILLKSVAKEIQSLGSQAEKKFNKATDDQSLKTEEQKIKAKVQAELANPFNNPADIHKLRRYCLLSGMIVWLINFRITPQLNNGIEAGNFTWNIPDPAIVFFMVFAVMVYFTVRYTIYVGIERVSYWEPPPNENFVVDTPKIKDPKPTIPERDPLLREGVFGIVSDKDQLAMKRDQAEIQLKMEQIRKEKEEKEKEFKMRWEKWNRKQKMNRFAQGDVLFPVFLNVLALVCFIGSEAWVVPKITVALPSSPPAKIQKDPSGANLPKAKKPVPPTHAESVLPPAPLSRE